MPLSANVDGELLCAPLIPDDRWNALRGQRVVLQPCGHPGFPRVSGLGTRHFVHTRDDGRKLRITVTGKNSGTISIAFQNDNPTQVDAEVTAQSLDSDGTLVIMDDELTENAT